MHGPLPGVDRLWFKNSLDQRAEMLDLSAGLVEGVGHRAAGFPFALCPIKVLEVPDEAGGELDPFPMTSGISPSNSIPGASGSIPVKRAVR